MLHKPDGKERREGRAKSFLYCSDDTHTHTMPLHTCLILCSHTMFKSFLINILPTVRRVLCRGSVSVYKAASLSKTPVEKHNYTTELSFITLLSLSAQTIKAHKKRKRRNQPRAFWEKNKRETSINSSLRQKAFLQKKHVN